MTDKARTLLEAYEIDVRRSLAGRNDVDPDDVVAGIREHVEAELELAGAPGTAEDVADALERLGPPDAWTDAPGDAGLPQTDRRGAILPALALVLLGGALAFTPRWAALGWALAIAGTLVVRIAGLPGHGAADAPSAGDVPMSGGALDRLARAWWWLAAALGAVALLAGPAVLAWGAAQTGGILEGPLSALTGTTDAAGLAGRPTPYWLATAAIAGMATGAWWVFVGLTLRAFGPVVRRALGPARALAGPRAPRRLLIGGSFLCAAALLCCIPLLGSVG